MQQIILQGTTSIQLVELINEGVKRQLEDFKKNFEPKAQTQYYSRSQVCKKLGISPATLHNWVKQKKLPCFGLGGRIFFKSEDIENSIIQLNK
ncbi:MAG: helix-turn-helix domain-containing protein [Flavobacteriaceae bacterium]|nr:helix-turn-helix domain-containing protein [Flavobacteriaceae bacterium]